MPAAIGACGTVVAAVAAVFAAGAFKNDPSPNVLVITPTPVATTPGATPTPQLTNTPERSHSIVAGEWDFRYTVLTNSCGFGTAEGGRIDYALEIDERYPDDGYIDEGDDAVVLDQGVQLGFIEITYPEFEFSYPVQAFGYNGTALVHITFKDSQTGTGFRKDMYTAPNGSTCSIVGEDH
ncbi:MAG: hypothetical protein ABI559_12060 [Chloroflexota bacterium]